MVESWECKGSWMRCSPPCFWVWMVPKAGIAQQWSLSSRENDVNLKYHLQSWFQASQQGGTASAGWNNKAAQVLFAWCPGPWPVLGVLRSCVVPQKDGHLPTGTNPAWHGSVAFCPLCAPLFAQGESCWWAEQFCCLRRSRGLEDAFCWVTATGQDELCFEVWLNVLKCIECFVPL